jgi:hypothetical protein
MGRQIQNPATNRCVFAIPSVWGLRAGAAGEGTLAESLDPETHKTKRQIVWISAMAIIKAGKATPPWRL